MGIGGISGAGGSAFPTREFQPPEVSRVKNAIDNYVARPNYENASDFVTHLRELKAAREKNPSDTKLAEAYDNIIQGIRAVPPAGDGLVKMIESPMSDGDVGRMLHIIMETAERLQRSMGGKIGPQ